MKSPQINKKNTFQNHNVRNRLLQVYDKPFRPLFALLFSLLLAFSSCSSGGGDLEIGGKWQDDYDTTHDISNQRWFTSSSFGDVDKSIEYYDNDKRYLIWQRPDDDDFNPNKYSKVVWLVAERNLATVEKFYYCEIARGSDTFAQAENAPDTSDTSDPENGGCGDFAWTIMTPR